MDFPIVAIAQHDSDHAADASAIVRLGVIFFSFCV